MTSKRILDAAPRLVTWCKGVTYGQGLQRLLRPPFHFWRQRPTWLTSFFMFLTDSALQSRVSSNSPEGLDCPGVVLNSQAQRSASPLHRYSGGTFAKPPDKITPVCFPSFRNRSRHRRVGVSTVSSERSLLALRPTIAQHGILKDNSVEFQFDLMGSSI